MKFSYTKNLENIGGGGFRVSEPFFMWGWGGGGV